MTMAVDNNGGIRRRAGNAARECYEWKERPGLVQEESPTGHSCNPSTKPLRTVASFRFRVELKVVTPLPAIVGNSFPELVNRLMRQKAAEITASVDDEP